MILLWGLPADRPLALVAEALRRCGCEVAWFDQRAMPRAEMELHVGAAVEGCLRWDGNAVDLAAVSAAYLRPYDSRRLPEVARAGEGSVAWQRTVAIEDALSSWAEVTPARMVNPPAAMAVNNSKPYQLAWIRALGFDVPETLITTDPDAVLAFWQRHGAVVYKSISSVRSVVSRLTPDGAQRLEDVIWCPTQFQAYVAGVDYRVHVVGDEVFAARIVSDRDDYRYAAVSGGSAQVEPYQPNGDLAGRCRRMVHEMGLLVAGIDLRQTPQGEWFCFEVNPSPGFSYYQDATGQPIDCAIADLLTSRGE